MEKEHFNKKVIKFVATNRMVKYIQAIELSSFLICGYLVSINLIIAIIFLFIGIYSAMIAGESALLEHDLESGDRNGY